MLKHFSYWRKKLVGEVCVFSHHVSSHVKILQKKKSKHLETQHRVKFPAGRDSSLICYTLRKDDRTRQNSAHGESNNEKSHELFERKFWHLVFTVEQEQVAEGGGRKRALLQEEGELLEAFCRLGVHVHEGLVVKCDSVELLRSQNEELTQMRRTAGSSSSSSSFQSNFSLFNIENVHRMMLKQQFVMLH